MLGWFSVYGVFRDSLTGLEFPKMNCNFIRSSGAGLIMVACLASLGCSRNQSYYIDRGNALYNAGKYSEAELNYRKAIQKDFRSAEAYYKLGLTELKQHQGGPAYLDFQRAVNFAPDRDDIRIELANLALSIYSADPNQPRVLYDQVASTADLLLKKNPNSFDGLRLRADVLAIDRKYADALAMFKRANIVKPLEPGLVLPMVQVLFRLNQTPEAEALARRFFQVHKDYGQVYDALVAYYLANNRAADAENVLKLKIANIPKNPDPILQLASFYRKAQRESEMTQTLQKLSKNSDFQDGYGLVGDFYANEGRWDDALGYYETGLRSSAKDKANYQKRIARVLLRKGRMDDAVKQLTEVLQAKPDDQDARTARAVILLESRDPKKLDWALGELKALKEAYPQDEVVAYNLGLAYLGKGDSASGRAELLHSASLRPAYIQPRLALAKLDQRERNYNETIRMTEEILSIDATITEAKLLHAAGLLGKKSFPQAQTELSTLLKAYPDSREVNMHMAILETAERKFGEAETRYRRFYKPGDKDPRTLEGLIQLYMEQRLPDKALALLEQEIKQAPESEPIHLLYATTAMQAGKLDLAMQQYEWLRSKDFKSGELYTSLGDLYQLKGDVNSALASYQRARELAPNNPKILAVIAFLQQNNSGHEQEAIASLTKELALDPQNAITMNNLAFALADTGAELDRALALAEAAQRKLPNNPGIADTVGWVYVRKGLNDSAIQVFSGLVKKYPDEPALRYHLGVALLQKGEAMEAKSEFVISLSKKPPKDMAEKIKQILLRLG